MKVQWPSKPCKCGQRFTQPNRQQPILRRDSVTLAAILQATVKKSMRIRQVMTGTSKDALVAPQGSCEKQAWSLRNSREMKS